MHELVFACRPLPPPRPTRSATLSLLKPGEWCATRAVARCELGLLPVIKNVETGDRVFLQKRPLFGVTVLAGLYPWRLKGQSKCCARGGRSSAHLPQSSSRFPQTRYSALLCLLVPNMPWKRKRCWTAREQDLGSREALISRDEESSEDDRPFLPRILIQETIFAHSTYEGSFTTGQAFKVIFCADQTGFACAGLQKQNARSSRYDNSRPILGAARANISIQAGASAVGPSASRRIQLAARSSALI